MKKQKNKIDISIVMPAYREGLVIQKTLEDVSSVLGLISPNYEIICVVDGYVDDTINIVRQFEANNNIRIKVLGYPKNMGKGYALRQGFSEARGEIIGFIDADGQIDPENLVEAIHVLKASDADIVVGSKKHKKSNVDYTLFRKSVSFVSQLFIRTLFGINATDTQAGLKVFRKEVVEHVLPKLKINRFAFDIEFLAIANQMGYKKIAEVPVKVETLEEDTAGVNFFLFLKDLADTFYESLKVFYRLKIYKGY